MTRLLDTNTRFFDEVVMTSKLKNEWGSLLPVLDEALVTGTTPISVSSLITVEDPSDSSYWLTTVTLPLNHKFETNIHVVEIIGTSDSKYNTVFRVQESKDTTIKIAFDKALVPNKPTDIPNATGVTIRLAPLGWRKAFTGTNKTVYKSANLNANDCYLRVDNSCPDSYDPSWAKFARVSMYNTMNHVDDYQIRPGMLKAPYDTGNPNQAETQSGSGTSGIYGWSKWYYSILNGPNSYETSVTVANSVAVNCKIIGDDKTFYIFLSLYQYTNNPFYYAYCFGEYKDITGDNNITNHILTASDMWVAANSDANFYYAYNPGRMEEKTVFARAENATGKFLFNDMNSNINTFSSIRADFSGNLRTLLVSGYNTGYAFNQYLLNINFSEVFLRAIYPLGNILKGKMRGYHWIANDLQSMVYRIPPIKSIVENIKNEVKYKYIILAVGVTYNSNGDTEYNGWQNSRIAFKLNNWE